jgi:adenylate cyclase
MIELGIGLDAGEAFCGAVGDETRLEFTVLGDTVNIAAWLEQETKAVELLNCRSSPAWQLRR